MFSYFENGIKNIIPKCSIELSELVALITSPLDKSLLEQIRNLKQQENPRYKQLKKRLPYITPACQLHQRNLKGNLFEKNFISFSNYIYIDIDLKSEMDASAYKKYFIDRYSNLVSLVNISSSGGGLGVLFKVSNTITKKNFNSIRSIIIDTHLSEEKSYIDTRCIDIGRPMFISYDPEVYYNYENEILIDDILIYNTELKKRVKQSISYSRDKNNRLIYSFQQLPKFEEFYSKIKKCSDVDVLSPIIDFNPIPFVQITFPNTIRDGVKHGLYTVLFHKLIYLNPTIEPIYLLAFVNFININFAYPPMEYRKLNSLFAYVYNITQQEDYSFSYARVKNFHFNQTAQINANLKKKISNSLNGKLRINKSIRDIEDAKDFLTSHGLKVTQKEVARVSGLSLKTVQTHYRKLKLDIPSEIAIYNDSISPTDDPQSCIKRGSSSLNTKPLSVVPPHPDCPRWVLEYTGDGFL